MIKEVEQDYFEFDMGGVMFPRVNLHQDMTDLVIETYIPLSSSKKYCVFMEATIKDCEFTDYYDLMKQIDCIMPNVNAIKKKYKDRGLIGFKDKIVYKII